MRKVHMIMKIKRLTKRLDAQTDWNFGYSPSNNPYFDAMVEERSRLLDKLKEVSPEEWEQIVDSI